MQIEVELVGLDGAIMITSHFDGFKDKALSLAYGFAVGEMINCW